MIPAGFRLGDGWRAVSPHWGCSDELCGGTAKYKTDSQAARALKKTTACAAHAVEMGALVAVAPVVEAPMFDREAWIEALHATERGLAATREKLAAAEQRAVGAEDKLRRIAEEVEASDERDCLCDHQRGDGHRPLPCFACRVADILREGT